MSDKVLIESVLNDSSIMAFKEALNGQKGDLDAWLECNDEAEVRAHIKALLTAQPQASAECDYCQWHGEVTRQVGQTPETYDAWNEPCPECDGTGLTQASAAQSAPAGEREPVAYVLTRDGEVCYEADDGIVISNTPGDETDLYKWRPVYFGAAWQRTQSTGVPVAPGWHRVVSTDWLKQIHRDLDACQKLIWANLRGCDPAYCEDAQARLAEIDAMLAAAPAQPAAQGEFGDAYQGAREDLAIWKRRALEAEDSVRELEARIDTLILDCQGESRMGEPVIPTAQDQGEVQRLREALEEVRSVIDAREMPSELALAALSNMIDAALAAQQSAPEQVSVPVELAARLQRFCQRPHSSRDAADALDMELRAILASTGQEVVNDKP